MKYIQIFKIAKYKILAYGMKPSSILWLYGRTQFNSLDTQQPAKCFASVSYIKALSWQLICIIPRPSIQSPVAKIPCHG